VTYQLKIAKPELQEADRKKLMYGWLG